MASESKGRESLRERGRFFRKKETVEFPLTDRRALEEEEEERGRGKAETRTPGVRDTP